MKNGVFTGMARILLVEDDSALAMGVEFSLSQEGYEVKHASTFHEAEMIIEDIKGGDHFDIALFDVMLPDGNGYELIRRFREQNILLPVIFLTAVSDEVNVVQGLELGADDYITKPFRVKELMSRIKAVLRRGELAVRMANEMESKNSKESQKTAGVEADKKHFITYRDIVIDTERVEVRLGDEELHLTPAEYKMLLYFIQNSGITLMRTVILERLFDEGGNFVDDNTLSVYVNRLREKIQDTKREEPYIRTIRGVGYRMEKTDV